MWKIGHVMSVTDGYGFNVTTDRGKPLVLFAYETQEAAEAAAKQVEAAVKRASRSVTSRISPDGALGPEEYRTGLIREGLRRELERREQQRAKPPRGKK
jgi:hypothetical protein